MAGVWAAEVTERPDAHARPWPPCATSRVTVGSNVVLAFTRNPMSVAMQAWDLARPATDASSWVWPPR